MRIVREGYFFIAGSLAVALLLGIAVNPYWAIPFVVLAGYFVYFFRNPERTIPTDDSVIVSPADGTVQDVIPM